MVKLYVVYDIVALMPEGPVMQFRADAAAVRFFHELLASPQTLFAKHPKDYELRSVANMIPETCSVLPAEVAVVATGLAWAAERDRQQLTLVKDQEA